MLPTATKVKILNISVKSFNYSVDHGSAGEGARAPVVN